MRWGPGGAVVSGYYIPYLGGKRSEWVSGREPELSGLRRSIDPLIVLVDDELMAIRLLELFFSFIGYHNIVSFSSGDGVLEYCQANRPRLLITDIRHDGLDGLELCWMIRNDPVLSGMPLVAHSGYETREVIDALEKLGVVRFPKPCDFQKFGRYVDEVLGRKREWLF